jgi:hypothetical protein
MAKKSAKSEAWTVMKLAKKPVRIGQVEAATEDEALKKAYEEFAIRDVDRFRISVRRGF